MSIWQVVEYSLVVSMVALLLLAMKRLFHDKLDARWHYLIWIVLGVRMVVPLSLEWLKSPLSLFEAIPVNYWTKLWALRAERAGISLLVERLLLVYLAGVLVFTGYYLIVALVVRIKTLRAERANQELYDRVAEVAAKYGLKSCKRIRVGGRVMPCVCGLFRPILVLPKQGVSEEVIVHELLHKKYGDVLINYGLHLVRALNWFNPLMWYVTAVILNDSEALCDQRVLELMAKQRGEGDAEQSANGQQTERQLLPVEKVYGNLLLGMAEKKGMRSARVGTTNMANSYRNMHTRIKRIADFRRVPAGVGFVSLCITVILSVSGIGYCDTQKIISCGVEDEKDLERVMLRSVTYEAETMEQAIYIYLKAMKEMNPIYLMAVTPEEELPELEAWIHEMFEQDKFVRWMINGESYIGNAENATSYSPAEWLTFDEEIIENPWFVWDGNRMISCWIYNLHGDETKGTATAELYVKNSEMTSFVNWELELLHEDGWKVRRLGEKVTAQSEWQEEPESMIQAEGASGNWLITAVGYNEANFNSLFASSSGFRWYQGSIPTMKESEESAEYPKQFDMQYKNLRVHAIYQGEEPLEDTQIDIVFKSYTEEEWKAVTDDAPALREYPPESEGGIYSSSNGEGQRYINGKTINPGEKILVTGGGGGYDGWEGMEELHFIAWIYYDGKCVEVIKQ